ncbi:ABC1 kinase family protein [Saccharothrix obliqua]|uniref:ABC1 kinase family protein n=1 Tax=Saccharothrix obliqua TaxID=2861747 RepID=UPI002150A008|nr:AarF/UbiB family protein [Saccharothrix obliqua]
MPRTAAQERIRPHQVVLRLAHWAGATAWHLGLGLVEAARDRITGATTDVAARRVGSWATGLGPTFVKGGQLLGTRRDVLPDAWCARLSALHDRVRPMSRAQAVTALAHAYPDRWPFARFDWTPHACGSIACVYRAELRDGRPVAVKLRRPRVDRRMRVDFALLAHGATIVQALPGMRRLPARRMVEQVGVAVRRQADLDHEADALVELRRNLGGRGRFVVPRPIAEASGNGALVMDFIEGLARFEPGDFTREQRRDIVRRVLGGVYRMLFIDGYVHCDMHPGNLYLAPGGEVVLLDAGFVVRLPAGVRRLFAEFFLDMATGRAEECAEVVLRSAEHVPPGSDVAGFRRGVVELVRAAHGQTAGRFRLAPFATRLFDVQRRSGISAAPEFVFPLVSLLVLEGMINDFDVDVDFQAEAVPTLLQALRA